MRRSWSRAWRWVDGATIHATARVHPSARLAPGVVVEARARVGAGVVLGPGAVVGSSVSVGAGTSVGPHTSLQHCSIGGGCTLHAGVRIGADGFGFVPGTPAGAEQSRESQRLERSGLGAAATAAEAGMEDAAEAQGARRQKEGGDDQEVAERQGLGGR